MTIIYKMIILFRKTTYNLFICECVNDAWEGFECNKNSTLTNFLKLKSTFSDFYFKIENREKKLTNWRRIDVF